MNSNWGYSPQTINLSHNCRFFGQCDLEICRMTLKSIIYSWAPLRYRRKLSISYPSVNYVRSYKLETPNWGQSLWFLGPCDLKISFWIFVYAKTLYFYLSDRFRLSISWVNITNWKAVSQCYQILYFDALWWLACAYSMKRYICTITIVDTGYCLNVSKIFVLNTRTYLWLHSQPREYIWQRLHMNP